MKWFPHCCRSVTKSYPTLCYPMNCSTPASPVHHYPRICSNSCLLSQWCHPTISSSVIPFFSCTQSFPESVFSSESFFTSGGQSIGASSSASVLPMNILDLFPIRLTGLISFPSKWPSRVFSCGTVRKHQFFSSSLLYGPTVTSIHDYWKNYSFAIWTFVGKVMSLLLNMLSGFVIAFLPRSIIF